ncbi:MAG: GH1 family beta-glucosidase [Rhodobacteraceae bacterium]|nr:GH1 family beta-glucosidase [Paracoccaceae bacterium]MCY4140708.1 GH1 family beta-glucosidase [Paracoccaceae bacterium]
MTKDGNLSFPDRFVWGVATAAYQIEGHRRADGGGECIWDVFARDGRTLNGDNGDIAADHYRRYPDDHALARDLGFASFRMSFSWPRISPEGSTRRNQAGFDHYDRVLDSLLENGLTPMVTLYHWDLPQDLQERGGWLNRDTAYRFADHAGAVVEHFGDRVPFWITTNEPWSCAFLGHARGLHAPGMRDYHAAGIATHNLNLAHGLAVPAIRASTRDAQVGVTHCLQVIEPFSDSPDDVEAARTVDGEANGLFLEPLLKGSYPAHMVPYLPCLEDDTVVREGDLECISAPVDFLGLNYYVHEVVRFDRTIPIVHACRMAPLGPLTTIGSGLRPDGLEEILLKPGRDYGCRLPIYVTEVGYLFNDYVNPDGRVNDMARMRYYDEAFRAADRAMKKGVDLRGIYVWTLLDDFEWDSGYSSRYGIVFVEYGTQTRIPKDSAYWLRGVARRNGLSEPPGYRAPAKLAG